jgi:hypothetical protein
MSQVNATSLFHERRAPIEARRQAAVRAVEERYRAAREQQLIVWQAARASVSARLEKAKATVAEFVDAGGNLPDNVRARFPKAGFDAANAAMIDVEQIPSDRPLRAQLDADIRAATSEFLRAEDDLRRQLQITPAVVNAGAR